LSPHASRTGSDELAFDFQSRRVYISTISSRVLLGRTGYAICLGSAAFHLILHLPLIAWSHRLVTDTRAASFGPDKRPMLRQGNSSHLGQIVEPAERRTGRDGSNRLAVIHGCAESDPVACKLQRPI
jgi:hypothetical protein